MNLDKFKWICFALCELRHKECKIKLKNGDTYHYKDGDVYSVCFFNNELHYFKNGRLHRDDGPAKIYQKDDEFFHVWYKNGIRHREDGPAIESHNGRAWYLNNHLHREAAPAIILDNGQEEWFLYGRRHREDGPAIITEDGEIMWFLCGKEYSREEYYVRLNMFKLEKELSKKESFVEKQTMKV